MKKNLFILLVIIFSGTIISAQLSQGFKYQAVIRDATGTILQNQSISLKINILQGSEEGTSVYNETWNIETNSFGLVNLNIGENNVDFAAINWGTENYWIKIDLDETGGTDYKEMGTSKLLSVPYSLYSNAPWETSENNIYYNAGNVGIGTSTPKAKFEVHSTGFEGDTLFCVKDANGKPVFIVYPDGVQVIIDTTGTTKSGASGRFLVSGRGPDSNAKDIVQPVLVVQPGGVEIIVDTTGTTKSGASGRFLVSGRGFGSKTEGIDQPVLVVQPGGVQVIVDTTATSKSGASGRFLVSGRGLDNKAEGTEMNFMDLTKKNYLIGHDVGSKITTGTKNSILGYEAGNNITSGKQNTFIGYRAGYNSLTGIENVFIGNFAGETVSGGIGNVNIGFGAGRKHNHDAGVNVYVGYASGHENTDGEHNVYVGYQAGGMGIHGIDNVYLGTNTGLLNSGSGNVFLGTDVGNTLDYVNVSNKLYIDNSDTETPLIWGDFTNDILKVYSHLNINDAYTFPTTDGGAGQVLKTDGNGNLTWGNITKSLDNSKEVDLLKITIKEQQLKIKKLEKENASFETRLKTLEKKYKLNIIVD